MLNLRKTYDLYLMFAIRIFSTLLHLYQLLFTVDGRDSGSSDPVVCRNHFSKTLTNHCHQRLPTLYLQLPTETIIQVSVCKKS